MLELHIHFQNLISLETTISQAELPMPHILLNQKESTPSVLIFHLLPELTNALDRDQVCGQHSKARSQYPITPGSITAVQFMITNKDVMTTCSSPSLSEVGETMVKTPLMGWLGESWDSPVICTLPSGRRSSLVITSRTRTPISAKNMNGLIQSHAIW